MGKLRYSVAVAEPAAPTVHSAEGVYVLLWPAQVSVTPVADAAAVPEFVTAMLATPAVAVAAHEYAVVVPATTRSAAGTATLVTVMLAVLDAEPKIPKTKPPIATAAIKVTAMINTVAMIGEIAFLCCCPYFPFLISIGIT